MKKLLLLTTTLLLTFTAISQRSNRDSCTCIENAKLRLAALRIEAGKRDSILLEICKEDNLYFKARIEVKDTKIMELQGKVADYKHLENSYQLEVKNLEQQKDIAVQGMEKLNRRLKGQKRLTVFGVLSAAVITSVTTFFIVTRTQ
jgi:hypothetical protein